MFVFGVVCINISLDVHQTVMWAVSARGHWPPHALHTFIDTRIFIIAHKNMGYLFFGQIPKIFTYARI